MACAFALHKAGVSSVMDMLAAYTKLYKGLAGRQNARLRYANFTFCRFLFNLLFAAPVAK